MQLIPSYDNSSERLQDSKASFGVAEIIREHGYELGAELQDISSAVGAMKLGKMSKTVEDWAINLAVNSNAIGNITGFNSGQSVTETSKAYTKNIDTEKTELKEFSEFGKSATLGELGDLKIFDYDENNQFLDEVISEIDSELKVGASAGPENTMLIEAQKLVAKYALEYPITDNRFSADNNQFSLVA